MKSIIYEGITYPSLSACCKATRRRYSTVRCRMKSGMSLEEAMKPEKITERKGKPVTYNGVTYKSLTEYCRVTGKSYSKFHQRLRYGHSLEESEALDEKEKEVTYNGVTYPSLYECCQATGKNYSTIYYRIKSGRTFEEAMQEKARYRGTLIEYDGVTYESLAECCRALKRDYNKVYYWLMQGRTVKEAMELAA